MMTNPDLSASKKWWVSQNLFCNKFHTLEHYGINEESWKQRWIDDFGSVEAAIKFDK